MSEQYLGYDDVSKCLLIYDSQHAIIKKYVIGECFLEFMDLDLKEYQSFYEDLEKIFHRTESGKSQLHSRKLAINTAEAQNFFTKYPVTKVFVIENARRIIQRMDKNQDLPEMASSLFDDCFEFKQSVLSSTSSNPEGSVYIKMRKWILNTISSIHYFTFFTWDLVYEYENPYIHNQQSIINHPYMKLTYSSQSNYHMIGQLHPHLLQKLYRDAFIFCFDTDYQEELNLLSAQERLYLYQYLNPNHSLLNYDVKSEYIFESSDQISADFTIYSEDQNPEPFLQWSKKMIDKNMIRQIQMLKLTPVQVFPAFSLPNIVAIEFQKMIESNVKIKKCKNCGKYFILKGDYATEYCDRILPNSKFTCKKTAAIQARKHKIKENPILKEYEKAYKRYYARLSSKKIPPEDFRLWVEEATAIRDQTLDLYHEHPTQETIDHFKEYLGNR